MFPAAEVAGPLWDSQSLFHTPGRLFTAMQDTLTEFCPSSLVCGELVARCPRTLAQAAWVGPRGSCPTLRECSTEPPSPAPHHRCRLYGSRRMVRLCGPARQALRYPRKCGSPGRPTARRCAAAGSLECGTALKDSDMDVVVYTRSPVTRKMQRLIAEALKVSETAGVRIPRWAVALRLRPALATPAVGPKGGAQALLRRWPRDRGTAGS